MDELLAVVRSKGPKVNGVWSIELPNHGEAATVNQQVMEWYYRPVCEFFVLLSIRDPMVVFVLRSCAVRSEDYARAIHVVVTNAGTGIEVNFSKRRLVDLGHSVGALAMYVRYRPHPQTVLQ